MEKRMTNKSVEVLARAYAREMYLWDDPFEAPSVPDESVLAKFVEKSDSIESDLADQIRNDLNCKRALDRVKFEKFGVFKNTMPLSDLGGIPEVLSEPVQNPGFDGHTETVVSLPVKGDIFYTKSKLKVFDDARGKNYNIYTFLPQAVLIISDVKRKPWGTKMFRCAVVTPDFAGGAVEGQDMDLGNGWILHKWLCYPVSFEQFDFGRKVGRVENIDKIADEVNSYFFSENKMKRYGREERRLLAKADYLPAMADADVARAEWQAEHSASFDAMQVYAKESFRKAASTKEDVSRLVVRRGENAVAEFFEAELDVIIDINAGNCERIVEEKALPTWTIDKGANMPDGTVFLLRDVRNGNTIGSGEISRGVAWLERLVPEAFAIPVTDASHVVLEVYLPW